MGQRYKTFYRGKLLPLNRNYHIYNDGITIEWQYITMEKSFITLVLVALSIKSSTTLFLNFQSKLVCLSPSHFSVILFKTS
jgi:hypothetical protein